MAARSSTASPPRRSGGFCLPEAQLAISGEMVVRAIYDTLTIPNSEGEYVPYLAESVTPNDDFTEWTIKLRDGVKFHDGIDADAEVVKNNLDAYRGHATRPGSRSCSPSCSSDIEKVEVDRRR